MFGAVAGAISSSSASTSSLTITAGTRAVTGFTAPEAAAITVGELIFIPKNTVANIYMGRVTRVSGTTVYVSPTPTQSFTSTAGQWSTTTLLQYVDIVATGTASWRGAQGGASWQNRLIFGGVTRELQTAVYEHLQNRIIWSLLPTETSATLAGADGDLFLSQYGWPANNYADVPWMNAVLGLEPVSDGELLITGRPLCSRLVGTLNTNTSTSGGLTYELRPLNQRIPCISDRATVRTPQGTMVMGPDGIYLYREGNLINTMVGRIQNLFLDTYASATVYGAGILPSNHYYLSTEQGLLLCNMDGFRWTKFQNTAITNNFADPSNTTRVFACRYQPGTASNTTKLVRADYLVNPSSTATTDAWGTGPLMTVKTKTYTDGDASRLKQFRHEEVTVRMPGSTGTVTVTSQPGLDGEETGATLGTISNGTSAQSKRYDTTTISRAMGLQIAQTGNPDECELVDVDIAPRPLRAGRVA
jgi:ribosomal protein L35AE/L33A